MLSGTHDVVVHGTGRAALESLQGGATFERVLCDVNLPDMTGLDVYGTLSGRSGPSSPRASSS